MRRLDLKLRALEFDVAYYRPQVFNRTLIPRYKLLLLQLNVQVGFVNLVFSCHILTYFSKIKFVTHFTNMLNCVTFHIYIRNTHTQCVKTVCIHLV